MITVMVASYSVFSIYSNFRTTRLQADQRIDLALNKVSRDTSAVKVACDQFSNVVLEDQTIMREFTSGDRRSTGAAVNALIARERFPGFVSIVDSLGNVFYSSEAPDRAGYSASQQSEAVSFVLERKMKYTGASDFSVTKIITWTAMQPIKINGNFKGIVCVSQPLTNEYLTGEVTKFGLEEPDPVRNVDLLVFSNPANKIVALTSGLGGGKMGSFGKEINQQGTKAFPNQMYWFAPNAVMQVLLPLKEDHVKNSFEKNGFWWYQIRLPGILWPDHRPTKEYGRILIATPVPDVQGQFISVLIVAGLIGGISLLFGFIFTRNISNSVNEPLRFLIDRTEDIIAKKKSIPPLEGLGGEWLELGEFIDTAVSTMRSTTQNLKLKLNEQKIELDEKINQVENANTKIEALNRQLSMQGSQISEISKQTHQASRQAVVVQHKLDAVLQSSSEGFLILDQFGNILSANPVFLNWSGCTEGEIAGRLCFDLIKKPGESRTKSLFGQAFASHHGDSNEVLNKFHPEGVIYHAKEDKSVEVINHLQPIQGEDNSIQGYIMVMRDKSLRSENAQLRQEIIIMLQDAIRNQLAVGEAKWVPLLSSSNPNNLSQQARQNLQELYEVYKNLLGVVDSYIMMYGGYVPPPVIPKEPIVITRLVADCLEEVTPLARDRQLLLDYKTVHGLPSINGNRDAARGILVQVLQSMIGVTAAGGRVRVESAMREGEMRISVSSSGPALPQVEIEDMFVGFIEGKHSMETYSDRLSMYLARNNIERLGGKIWAESEAGRGTFVYFTLPGHI